MKVTPQVTPEAVAEYRKDEAIASIDTAAATLAALGFQAEADAIRDTLDAQFPEDSERDIGPGSR